MALRSNSNAQAFGTLYTIPLNTAPRSNTFTAATAEDGDEKMRVLCIFQPSLANDPVMKDFRCNTKGITGAFLTLGQDGNLYGTTTGGNGTAFKATTNGDMTSLHEFNGKDGTKPFAIMQASDGNLYGTAASGGAANWGTLYRINPDVIDFLALNYFTQPNDNSYRQGANPYAGVVEGSDGQLYGALSAGGLYSRGVLFHVAKDGSNFGILHEFDSAQNGAKPVTTPVIVEDKTYGPTIYGTTDFGGKALIGTLYRMRVNRVTITNGILKYMYGPVDVRVDATATQGVLPDPTKRKDHGIAVRLKCDTDPHFVQFIYREVIYPNSAAVPPGGESQPNGRLLASVPCCQTSWGDAYPVTINLNDIHWNPDAPDKPTDTNIGSPFFEAGHSAERDCDSLALYDRPEFPVPNSVSRAVARDYAICNGVVKAQVTWISDETLDAQQNPHWNYQVAISPASNIPDYFLCQLQNKHYQLPPGQSIGSNVICTHLPSASVGNP